MGRRRRSARRSRRNRFVVQCLTSVVLVSGCLLAAYTIVYVTDIVSIEVERS